MKSIYWITISKEENSLVLCQFDLLFQLFFNVNEFFFLKFVDAKKYIYIVSIYETVLFEMEETYRMTLDLKVI